jgi:hypothetical protein
LDKGSDDHNSVRTERNKLNYISKNNNHAHGGFVSEKEREEYAALMQKANEA